MSEAQPSNSGGIEASRIRRIDEFLNGECRDHEPRNDQPMNQKDEMAESSNTQSLAEAPAGPTAQQERALNIPNIITLVRIGVVPVLLFLPLMQSQWARQLIAWLFIVAALTDLLDGWIARSWKMVTRLGKLLDPLADKLLISTALIMLVVSEPSTNSPGWWERWAMASMAVIIIGRELAVTGLRGIASAEGVIVAASGLGKLKTFAQNVAVIALLFHYPMLGIPTYEVGMVMLAVAAVLTLYSGWVYFANYFGWRESS